jgi:TatD DNase family protein
MLIDTHAHLNFDAFKDDADEVIRRSLDEGVWMINVGSHFKSSQKAVALSQKYEKGVYAAIGLHPINLDTGLVRMKRDEVEGCYFEKEFEYDEYKELAQSKKVVAIGEIGLDYYWRPKTTAKKELFKQKQKELLSKQLKLAKELNLPVIFHCRVAHDDLIDFLDKNPKIRPEKAITHGFVGSSEQLKKYLNFGFYIGFNGIIFKKIEGIDFEKNIKETPLEKILVETDCPYLPPPSVGGERNEPIHVKYVAEEIAKIKNISLEKVAKTTTQNAKQLFQI